MSAPGPGPGTFVVRQERDAIASGRLARVAVIATGVGLLAVFFSGLLLETNTGGIRGHLPYGQAPRAAGVSIAHIEQTPILGAAVGLDPRAEQREQLARYQWLDRDAGLVAIPIDVAMDLVAKGAP